MEIDLTVTPRRRRVICWGVVRFETFVRRPRLQQRPIHREMIRRDVTAQLRLRDDRRKETVSDRVIQQPVTVLRERRRIKRPSIDRHVQEPFEQHVVIQSLAERTL